MRSSSRADRLALTGPDCFLRAFDAETARLSRASHLSQLVLRLGPGFDPVAFEERLRAIVGANPIIRAPIRRNFLIAPPSFDLRSSVQGPDVPVERHELHDSIRPDPVSGRPPIPDVFFRRISGKQRIEKGELLRFDWVSYPDGPIGADIAMTWAHMLLDGSGSELFIERLARAVGDTGELSLDTESRAVPACFTQPLQIRSRLARDWLGEMNELARVPPVSLGGAARRGRQELCYTHYAFDHAESSRVQERASAIAGFLTPVAFYLAVAIRAHHAVFVQRGIDPKSYVVPLPVNLRVKGRDGPVFQTQVSMLWFQVMPEIVEDFQGLVDTIKSQRLEAIKKGLIERNAVALDLIRFVPSRAYARLARSTFRGELASFLFAFTGDFLPDLDDFFGAKIVDGFHAPSVTPSPGSGLIMSFRDGRLNVAHVHQRAAFSAEDRARLSDRLIEDLAGKSWKTKPMDRK